MIYALIENDALELRRQEFAEPPNNPPGKPQWKWLPVIREDTPSYDPLRERVDLDVVIEAEQVSETWAVSLKTADERKASVDAELARLVEAGLGTIPSRLKLVTHGVLLIDAVLQGAITINDPQFDTLRAIATWWRAMEAHALSLRTQINNGGHPAITGWPVQEP